TGFPITYSITNPGVHDVKVLETLSEEVNLPNILGDKGYISHKIHEKLALKGITISVPPRKNMDKSEKLDHSLLGKQRKTVKGLESRFESILLAYSVLLNRAQRRFEGTSRYSLGY
ncbi:transposase, partial [Enterococcus faecium]|uniref:transposase n=1 Tax=Enterococcus faecium TaxID=1352 RepID=UPI001C01AD16